MMKIAIVGCGQFADAHFQEIRRVGGAVVEAVCDPDPHMVEQAATRFGVARSFTDLESMLAEIRPDVVHITSPPATHLPVARAVVRSGAHAYVEKPFTVTAAEAEELVACAKEAGRLVCVGHSHAFDPPMLRLKDAVSSGRLGEVVHVESAMGYGLSGPFGRVMMGDPGHWVHRLPGGIAQNNVSHPLSLVLAFLPDPGPRVSARGLRWRADRFGDARDRWYDELRVGLEGRSSTASVTFTCRARPLQLYVTVHGTKAQATASLDARTLRVTSGASLPGPLGRVQWARHDLQEARREAWGRLWDLMGARLHFFQGLFELIRRFYLAVDGRGEMPIPMDEAVRTTRLMEEAFRLARAGDEEAR